MISSTTKFYSNESNSTLFNTSYWKLDHLPYIHSSSTTSHPTLITLILYVLCILIALTLLIILFSIIMFTYRKHCCPLSSSMIKHQYQTDTNKLNNRIGIQIENIDHDNQTAKAMTSNIRTCFE